MVPGWTPAPQPFPAECRKLGDGPDGLVAGQWVQSPTVASLICPPSALTRDVTQDRSCRGRVRTGRQVAALGLAGHGTGADTAGACEPAPARRFHVAFSVAIIQLELGENQGRASRKGVEPFDCKLFSCDHGGNVPSPLKKKKKKAACHL